MAQVLVEDQHGPGYDPPVPRLQNVPRRAVQVAVDVCVRQRSALVHRGQEPRDRVREQPLVEARVALLRRRHGPARAVRPGRLAPPRHGQAREGVEAVHGRVQGEELLRHPQAPAAGHPKLADEAVVVLQERLGGLQGDLEHGARPAVEVQVAGIGAAGVPADVTPGVDETCQIRWN